MKYQKSIDMIADSIESGYTALFTFAIKEDLDSKEKRLLAQTLRNLAPQIEDSISLKTLPEDFNLNREKGGVGITSSPRSL